MCSISLQIVNKNFGKMSIRAYSPLMLLTNIYKELGQIELSKETFISACIIKD